MLTASLVWLGGSDVAREGLWRWVDDGSRLEDGFTVWADEEGPDKRDR